MPLIALVGNPNVGKSTLFNALTGLNQHTGNWHGKTVELAQGRYTYKGQEYHLVDLPGAYSLVGQSAEEKITEDFIKAESADCVLALCDATCLERSLILILQVLEQCANTVVCINLVDEARRDGFDIATEKLSMLLGVPVVATSARSGEGLERLCEKVRAVCDDFEPLTPLRCEGGEERFVLTAQTICQAVLSRKETGKRSLTQRLDHIFLHRFWAYPMMLLLLLLSFWLTIVGANYPSQGLQWCFDRLGELLHQALSFLPPMPKAALLNGVYATLARVVAVMLPPMAIFFPLFTILEDFGYLPRVAFLLDERFRRSGACGKQALTLCMGFGCNAAGVTGCRIIESPRERLTAILTNAFVPCNGRFPALIFLIGLSFSGGSSVLASLCLTVCVLLSVAMTLLASKLLHGSVLRGEASAFVLEMPPYRKPRIGQVLIRSLKDRTLFILGRAAAVAAPAGLIIWCLNNIHVDGQSLLLSLAAFLDRPAAWIGLNGAVLLGFLLGSPANELVLPIILMIFTAGSTYASESSATMTSTLLANGWDWKLSLCTIVFMLFHWPCTTTLWTIYKETKRKKWTLLAALLPTAFGIVLCFFLNLLL